MQRWSISILWSSRAWGRSSMLSFFFFFQAEDGIRDYKVTGVQTCALPIFKSSYDKANRTSINAHRGLGVEEALRILGRVRSEAGVAILTDVHEIAQVRAEIGRASCRERV